jgi:hypothetical protein
MTSNPMRITAAARPAKRCVAAGGRRKTPYHARQSAGWTEAAFCERLWISRNITEKKTLLERFRRLANSDELTGLARGHGLHLSCSIGAATREVGCRWSLTIYCTRPTWRSMSAKREEKNCWPLFQKALETATIERKAVTHIGQRRLESGPAPAVLPAQGVAGQ